MASHARARIPTPLSPPGTPARAWRRARAAAPAWLLPVVGCWVATRAGIAAVAWLASWLVGHGWLRHREPGLRHPPRLTDVLGGWDGAWYRHIALNGYPHVVDVHRQSAVAFFPLVALLTAGVHGLGVPALGAALLVGNLAALGALAAIAALTARVVGPDLAVRTAVYVAISPLAVVLAMPYSEPLAMAAGFGAAALALADRPWLALPLGVLAGLSRPTGVLFVIPLAAIAVKRWPRRPGLLLVAAAPLAGLGLFSAYLWMHTGDPLAFAHAQSGWGRQEPGVHGIDLGALHAVRQLQRAGSLWSLRDVAIGMVSLGLLAEAARRRLPPSWIVFGALCILIPLASGSTQSLARFALPAIPVFWVLARLGRRPAFDQAYTLVAPMLLAASVLTLPLHWP